MSLKSVSINIISIVAMLFPVFSVVNSASGKNISEVKISETENSNENSDVTIYKTKIITKYTSNNSLSPRGEDFKKLLTINPWEQNYSEAWENYFSKSND